MGKLEGKVAAITGAAGGIGQAAARLFRAEGARLVLVDLDEAALRPLADELEAVHAAGDVSEEGFAERYVGLALERFGGLDALLLNAGIEGDVAALRDYPTALYDRVMAVNVRGVWLGLKAAMPEMARRGGGSIVVTSSTAGIRAIRNQAPYIASKHAAVGLMRAAALEGAADKVRVNSVNPSATDTRMIHAIEDRLGVSDADRASQSLARATPLQRYGRPEEVARLMLFLASDDSGFCTGGVYMVDGGVSAGRL